jgi:CHASE2 domain-containing sensor protein
MSDTEQRKLVVLRFGEGNFDRGFPCTLQIGEEKARPMLEITGKLPPSPEMPSYYNRWQSCYYRLGNRTRLEAISIEVRNVSLKEKCLKAARELRSQFNTWLNADRFQPIRDKWLERLDPDEEIRVILQTESHELQQLPWHLWEILDRYPKAELALSTLGYERVINAKPEGQKVKILAILGNSQGIDLQADRALLTSLANAQINFLAEPSRQELTDELWQQSWSIFFFAGHSSSQNSDNVGKIWLNQDDSLSVSELKYALRQAVERGLKLAIFNSCDGLGLARELADLQIGQIVIFREPVPDRVAQSFLKYFLEAFSGGESLYLSVRHARERLQAIEAQFPCATWLPIVYQNPAEIPPTWQDLQEQIERKPKRRSLKKKLIRLLATSLTVTGLLGGVRYLGLLQTLELKTFDRMMRQRPTEASDPRLLLVTIDEEDMQEQERGYGSLSDSSFERLLQKLEPAQPRAIGLDIYRDFPVNPKHIALKQQLEQNQCLIAVCKVSNSAKQFAGIAPPPEIPEARQGFSDFVEDSDGVLRRHLLYMNPEPSSPCATKYSFSLQLAFRYLAAEGILPSYTPNGQLKFGNKIFPRLYDRAGGYQKIDGRGGQILLNYRANNQPFDRVSLRQILNGQFDPKTIKNRIILVGVIATDMRDYWMTPYGNNPTERMPGVLVQAEMVSQIISAVLDKRPLLWVWSSGVDLGWIWLWSLFGGLLGWQFFVKEETRSRLFVHLAIRAIAASGSLYLLCFAILCQGGWIPLVPSVSALISCQLITYFLENKKN